MDHKQQYTVLPVWEAHITSRGISYDFFSETDFLTTSQSIEEDHRLVECHQSTHINGIKFSSSTYVNQDHLVNSYSVLGSCFFAVPVQNIVVIRADSKSYVLRGFRKTAKEAPKEQPLRSGEFCVWAKIWIQDMQNWDAADTPYISIY